MSNYFTLWPAGLAVEPFFFCFVSVVFVQLSNLELIYCTCIVGVSQTGWLIYLGNLVVIDMFVPYELLRSLLVSLTHSVCLSLCHSVSMLHLIGQPNCQKVKLPSDWLMSVECREAGIK